MQPFGFFRRALVASLLTGALAQAGALAAERVDFNQQIRPILSENCYFCHGPDANHRKAGLRLDVKEDAFKELKGGGHAIVAGDPAKSELLKRILTEDEDDLMPPPKTDKKLTSEQIALIKGWIDQGAEWAEHWSYVPPRQPATPEVKAKDWVRNAIDAFVLARLEKEGLSASGPAEKAALIRRLSFDLRGLPPTIAEVDEFLADKSADAYEKLVERFLESEQFGERMAQHWLDLARYADTNGYHIDNHRDMWKWREWVIRAFNENKPYDIFTIEQLAGDLLPNATLDQKIASGFNRNGMVNFEGGADPDEYLTKYIVDRVVTTANVWMGSTIGCAECHDHKYDPFSQKEFYQFYSYFHNVPERGLDGNVENPVPFMRLPTPEQAVKLADLVLKLPDAERVFKEREIDLPNAQAKWEKDNAGKAGDYKEAEGYLLRFALDEDIAVDKTSRATPEVFYKGAEPAAWVDGRLGKGLKLTGKGSVVDAGHAADVDRNEPFSVAAWVKPEGSGGVILSKMDDAAKARGWDLGLVDGLLWVHLIHAWDTNAIKVVSKEKFSGNNWRHVGFSYDGSSKAAGVKLFVDGKPVAMTVEKDSLADTIQSGTPLHLGKRKDSFPFNGTIDDARVYLRALKDEELRNLALKPIYDTITLAADKRTEEQRKELARYFKENFARDFKGAESRLNALRKEKDDLFKEIPVTMVMEEMPTPRKTHLLVRGNFQQKGEEVKPGLPAIFGVPSEVMPTNRLGLAKWLVTGEHPLTARVTVNRFWGMLFGAGLVRTANDFGSQGEFPSHPELLDWLASEFVKSKWDVKQMIRLMVNSSTYRQNSNVKPEHLEKDAYNRLLARGPRYRLDAEFVRDNALAISGLLNPEIGGRSVFPYQPPGLWEEVSFGAGFSSQNYVQSKGKDLYRRGLYTYWKRSIHYPSFATFDAPNREVCVAQRPRTTTPLQALVLMNDPVYVEAARALAARTLKEGGDSTRSKLEHAFRLTLGRAPKDKEIAVLEKTLLEQRDIFEKDKAAAESLISVGESPRPEGLDTVELAAWTAVSSVLLNLDETITKI